jgi:hypothetical protein
VRLDCYCTVQLLTCQTQNGVITGENFLRGIWKSSPGSEQLSEFERNKKVDVRTVSLRPLAVGGFLMCASGPSLSLWRLARTVGLSRSSTWSRPTLRLIVCSLGIACYESNISFAHNLGVGRRLGLKEDECDISAYGYKNRRNQFTMLKALILENSFNHSRYWNLLRRLLRRRLGERDGQNAVVHRGLHFVFLKLRDNY